MRPCICLTALLLGCCGVVGVYHGVSKNLYTDTAVTDPHGVHLNFQNIELGEIPERDNEIGRYKIENFLYKILKPSDELESRDASKRNDETDDNNFDDSSVSTDDVTAASGKESSSDKQEATTTDYDEEIEVEDGDIGEIPDPPDHKQTARMSRYLCHYSDWLAMATISTRGVLSGTPFASIFSFSDGPMKNSTGIPYFYMTNMDMSTHDLQKNPKASVTISLAQSGYCNVHELDPEDPRCAHVILAGEVIKVMPNSTEENFAKEALFSRHPVMPDWPEDHGWYFAKLDISNVILLDFFGGAIDVPLEEYFSVNL